MPDWNPSADVVGFEWMTTVGDTELIRATQLQDVQRIPSTTAETIDAVRLGAQLDPSVSDDLRTMVEVIEEDNLFVGGPSVVDLAPNSDAAIGTWTDLSGSSASLFDEIDSGFVWPDSGVQAEGIQETDGFSTYEATVDASAFAGGGGLSGARVARVTLMVVAQAVGGGFRQLRLLLRHATAGDFQLSYSVQIHGFGAVYEAEFGELNPATGLPWIPSDIADFDTGGDWTLAVRSQHTSSSNTTTVYSLGLRVHYIEDENREAVGTWRRTTSVSSSLADLTTDEFRTFPAGTAGWSKPSGVNHLWIWRQARTPYFHGGSPVANDVRWFRVHQNLGADGNPAGIVFPLTNSGTAPAPDDVLARDEIDFDIYGLSPRAFNPRNRAQHTIVPEDDLGAASIDSQPYRLSLADFTTLNSSQTVGQQVTPSATISVLTVRASVFPPSSGGGDITFTVHEVAGGAQVGGSLTFTAAEVRAVAAATGGSRYLEGHLTAGATLTMGTAYEFRMTVTGSGDWLAITPYCGLGASASFGGTTDGSIIGGVLDTDRDTVINMLAQPDPPQNVAAEAVPVPVDTWTCSQDDVEHIQVSWDPAETPLGSAFDRWVVQRSLDGGATWVTVAIHRNETERLFEDHDVPRGTEVVYRVRQVSTSAAFSEWVTTDLYAPAVASAGEGCALIITSNLRPDLELVYDYDPEQSYTFLSHDGTEVVPIHGADLQVVFIQPEDRGISAQFTLNINFGEQPTDPDTGEPIGGRAVFEPLDQLTRRLDLPYLTVLDRDGNRWFAHVQLSDASVEQPGHRYRAPILVIPITDTPTPIETEPS